jgi:hypothetical protein
MIGYVTYESFKQHHRSSNLNSIHQNSASPCLQNARPPCPSSCYGHWPCISNLTLAMHRQLLTSIHRVFGMPQRKMAALNRVDLRLGSWVWELCAPLFIRFDRPMSSMWHFTIVKSSRSRAPRRSSLEETRDSSN